MSYLAGFQALEQRDSEDCIVAEGVVSKRTPFASSDNTGIYDVIAEDLRYLNDMLIQLQTSNDLSSIRDEVKKMYTSMITDSNFGSVEAKAQAEIATSQATIATEKAKEIANTLASILAEESNINNDMLAVQETIKSVKTYLADAERIKEQIQGGKDTASEKADEATEQAIKASKSEVNAKTWAESEGSPDNEEDTESTTGKSMSSRGWAMFSRNEAVKAKTSEDNTKSSETNAKESETKAKQSEDNAKTSENNAKESETNAKTSENVVKEAETNVNDMLSQTVVNLNDVCDFAEKAHSWAEGEPTSEVIKNEDGTETIIEHKSAKAWAIESKKNANEFKISESKAQECMEGARTAENNAKIAEANAKASDESAKKHENNAKTYSDITQTYEVNAKTAENNAKISENLARAWAESDESPDNEFDSDNSTGKTMSAKGWAKVAKEIANNAKSTENMVKNYMESAKTAIQESQTIVDTVKSLQTSTNTLYEQGKDYLNEAKELRMSIANAVTYKGIVPNYSDLPNEKHIGDMYCITNADPEHEINANDKVIWNGEDWDNNGGGIDDTVFARQGNEVRFKTVTAETFKGNLDGNAKSADIAKSIDWENVKGRPERLVADGGRADKADICTGNAATASLASKAECDGNGDNIAKTYIKKETFESENANLMCKYLHIRQRNKDYILGDICFSSSLPSWAYLECCVAGTTAETLDETIKYDLGAVVVDGTASFIVRKVNGHSKGDIWAVSGTFDTNGFYIDPVYGVDLSVHICNGTNGTPDLRNRMIVGAGSSYAQGATGGEATHKLTVAEMPSHNHSASSNSTGAHTHTTTCYKTSASVKITSFPTGAGTTISYLTGGAGRASNSAGAHAHTITVNANGSNGAHNNMPPYYALSYVMQIK